MSYKTIDHNIKPHEVSPKLLGSKAYNLLELYWLATQMDSQVLVPRFCFATADLITAYCENEGLLPVITYSPLAAASEIPSAAIDYFKDFYPLFKRVFKDCVDRLRPIRQIYIGSSISLGLNSNLSFAGINCRTEPYQLTSDSEYLRYAITHVVAGLYRPMTEWYLSCHHLAEEVRSAGIMFYEFIETDFEAVAHIVNEYVYVECKSLISNATLENVNFTLSSKENWSGYWKNSQHGERLKRALLSLIELISMDRQDVLEVEFCFDNQDELYFLQYRTYRVKFDPDKTQNLYVPNIPVFSQVGKISGTPYSLLNKPKSLQVLSDIYKLALKDNQRIVWLVNRHSEEWDSFALLWALSRRIKHHDSRIAICHYERRPFHLTTVMREDPNTFFFAEVDLTMLPSLPLADCISIESNGIQGILKPAEC